MEMNSRTISVSVAIVVLTVFGVAQATKADHGFRQILVSDDFRFNGLAQLFVHGQSNVPALIEALDDPDEKASDNAQFALRVIGGKIAMDALHSWYLKPRPDLRIVPGPVPIPLQDWDYNSIERQILAQPARAWHSESINYLFALSLDGSSRAGALLKRMLEAASNNENNPAFQVAQLLQNKHSTVFGCSVDDPKNVLKKNAFFLNSEERKRSDITLIAVDRKARQTLLSISQTFGYTYLVVLRPQGRCWKFQSIALYSINN